MSSQSFRVHGKLSVNAASAKWSDDAFDHEAMADVSLVCILNFCTDKKKAEKNGNRGRR
jgi:hypothetical protein